MQLSVRHGNEQGALCVDPAPKVCTGFEELTESRFEVPRGGPWSLRIDDEPIQQSEGAWRWTPGFFAGEVEAELSGPDGMVVARYRLDVSPDRTKLGQASFLAMQSEIAAEQPALLAGSEPATTLLGNEEPLEGMLEVLVAFSRLRRHVLPFVSAVQEVSRQPRTMTRHSRAGIELHRVRRADARTTRLLARTQAAAVLWHWEAPSSELSTAGPALADVPWRETTVDCAANRCVLALMDRLLRRVDEVRAGLRAQAGRHLGETRTALDARLSHREQIIAGLEAMLLRLRRADPWRRVSRSEVTGAGLNALAADPRYARIDRLAWKALRRGIGGDSPEDRVWLSPTWEIFERWCFVRLARLIRERHPELSWSRHAGSRAPARALSSWVGRGSDVEMAVLLQAHFPSWDQVAGSAYRSVSRERWPDLVVTVTRGATRRWVALDAKYRRARQNVLEAMESAHIYRDSLRWHGRRADTALLFVPAEPGASWLTDPVFHEAERVGAWVLDQNLPPAVLDALGPAVQAQG